MKFSALVLSLALSTSAAFAPSASRTSTFQRFSTNGVETAPAVEENAEAEEKPAVLMETPAASVPVALPVAAEEKVEVPVAAEETVDKIIP
jgi:hypothetical protein